MAKIAHRRDRALITITGLKGIPLIKQGDDLGYLIVQAAKKNHVTIEEEDTIVVTQKVVSKAEGRTANLRNVRPSVFANAIAYQTNRDPRVVNAILREAPRIVRIRDNHFIVETRQGYICANAGIDRSNIQEDDTVSMLPKNPDEAAQKIRRRIKQLVRANVAVIISDTFGRAWRLGHVNFAIGVAGMRPMKDYRGKEDMFGYRLHVTLMAIADELASAAELVMNKKDGVPVAIVKGYRYPSGRGIARELVRPIQEDLFR